jgi:hypothetical protein
MTPQPVPPPTGPPGGSAVDEQRGLGNIQHCVRIRTGHRLGCDMLAR